MLSDKFSDILNCDNSLNIFLCLEKNILRVKK